MGRSPKEGKGPIHVLSMEKRVAVATALLCRPWGTALMDTSLAHLPKPKRAHLRDIVSTFGASRN